LSSPPFVILLVEDDPAHAMVIERAFRGMGPAVRVDHCEDGQIAVDALRDGSMRPDLVLLDLKLTGLQGLDVLGHIKSDRLLRSVPVVVLTTSVSDHDRAEAFRRHANAYIQKPERLEEFRAIAGALVDFWAGCHVRR
jgi:CheY-like chemotaxis protein